MINTVMGRDTIVITWKKSQQRWLLNRTCKIPQFVRQCEKAKKRQFTCCKMSARYQGYHYHYLGYHFTRCSLVLRKPSLIHFYIMWCGYSSVSFESFVLSHLVIVPVHNTKKLPLSACPSTPQGNQCEMLHFVPSMGPCNLCLT